MVPPSLRLKLATHKNISCFDLVSSVQIPSHQERGCKRRIGLVCSLMVPLMGHLHYLLTAEGLRTIGLVVYARNQLDTQLAHLPYRSRGGPRHRWTNLPASASGALTPCQWAARAATHTRSNRHRLVPDVIYPPTTYTTTCPPTMEVRRARPRCS